MEKHIDSQEYHENNLWGYKFVFICNFNPSRIRREGGCQPPLPLLLREKTFVTPVKLKNFRWNFAGVHQIYRNTFWKKCILWWRHCWLWNFCEAKVDQTIDIFSDLSFYWEFIEIFFGNLRYFKLATCLVCILNAGC